MASTVNPNSEINVTYEDQSKINRFAAHNSKMEEVREELKSKEKELANIEDALREMDLLSFMDDGFQIMEGEVLVQFTAEEAMEWVTRKKDELLKDVRSMKDDRIKAELYSKFGRSNINLESDD
ncbi:putative prefoldin subunit 4 [Brevipalpus obovatus]|uniref:putative prefoldin subunit 4 n=1 Tax=Brevipalpus obovatus TaxID=246614 RepID=UPI003D9DFD5D